MCVDRDVVFEGCHGIPDASTTISVSWSSAAAMHASNGTIRFLIAKVLKKVSITSDCFLRLPRQPFAAQLAVGASGFCALATSLLALPGDGDSVVAWPSRSNHSVLEDDETK